MTSNKNIISILFCIVIIHKSGSSLKIMLKMVLGEEFCSATKLYLALELVPIIHQVYTWRLRFSAGSRTMETGFSKDQLKGKQLSPTFWPDALVVFVKVSPEDDQSIWSKCWRKFFSFKLVFRESLVSIKCIHNINL